MLRDYGWDWVPMEGDRARHAECQVRRWAVGSKGFFHLVLRQGSDLGLDK